MNNIISMTKRIYNPYISILPIFTFCIPICLSAQEQKASTPFSYRVETSVSVADGRYAPLWFTANRYGLSSQEPKSAYLRAGVQWQKEWQHGWRVQAGADLAGGKNLTADFFVQQAYMDVAWKAIKMSIGSKERNGFPLEKDVRLSSGMMVEGANARPIPQVRVGLPEYLTVPFTGNWLALKGHIAYGLCTDGNWQEEFAGADEPFLKDVLYHSKSLMLRFGNREKLPLELEIGLLDIAQFGGKRYVKNADGSIKLLKKYPAGLKSFFKALVCRVYQSHRRGRSLHGEGAGQNGVKEHSSVPAGDDLVCIILLVAELKLFPNADAVFMIGQRHAARIEYAVVDGDLGCGKGAFEQRSPA